MSVIRSAAIGVAIVLAVCTTPVKADLPLEILRAEVARIGEMVDGNVGASIAIDGGKPIPLINGDKRFLFMSTVKILVAIEAMKQVEKGKFALDQPVEITQADLAVGTPVNMTFPKGPTVTPLYNLIWTMIVDSDNSAPNTLMRLMNGPKGVETFFNDRGVTDLSVDHNIRDLFVRAYEKDNIDQVAALIAEKNKLPGGSVAFLTSPFDSPIFKGTEDTITPNAMVRILSMLVKGEIMDAEHTKTLMSIMEQTRTGPKRLRGMLPPKTVVGHKTGTGASVINDVGYIRLPDERTVVIAVYTNSAAPASVREDVIAEISRAAYDYALYAK